MCLLCSKWSINISYYCWVLNYTLIKGGQGEIILFQKGSPLMIDPVPLFSESPTYSLSAPGVFMVPKYFKLPIRKSNFLFKRLRSDFPLLTFS